jgi:hypothetical protein
MSGKSQLPNPNEQINQNIKIQTNYIGKQKQKQSLDKMHA